MTERERSDYDKTDIVRYGLGKVRSFDKYLSVFGINMKTGEIYNHCAETFTGLLHDRLHAFLRKDSRGINYNVVYVPKEHENENDTNNKNENKDENNENNNENNVNGNNENNNNNNNGMKHGEKQKVPRRAKRGKRAKDSPFFKGDES